MGGMPQMTPVPSAGMELVGQHASGQVKSSSAA